MSRPANRNTHSQRGDRDREGDWVQQEGSKGDSKVFYALLLPGKWRWNKDSHSQKRHTTHFSLLLVMWGDREIVREWGVEIEKEGEKERKNRRGFCIMREAVVHVCMPECSPHFGAKASHIADLPWRILSPFPPFYFRLKLNLQYVYPNHHVLVWLKRACAYSTSRLCAAGKSCASLLTVLQCSNLQCQQTPTQLTNPMSFEELWGWVDCSGATHLSLSTQYRQIRSISLMSAWHYTMYQTKACPATEYREVHHVSRRTIIVWGW